MSHREKSHNFQISCVSVSGNPPKRILTELPTFGAEQKCVGVGRVCGISGEGKSERVRQGVQLKDKVINQTRC